MATTPKKIPNHGHVPHIPMVPKNPLSLQSTCPKKSIRIQGSGSSDKPHCLHKRNPLDAPHDKKTSPPSPPTDISNESTPSNKGGKVEKNKNKKKNLPYLSRFSRR
ncbi:hypothetical protein JTE90_008753 [Oedothorax gibbosus]|uniref:Uncharacterized protein n=1 Tax=Oedothorax gibbosus TaxID=931172 RepID=A0AAV6USD9_9ARAC|nr:hypothetical protein JTE90_008753 [Oedothorax gibbosus]